jgi:peroxiredoxin
MLRILILIFFLIQGVVFTQNDIKFLQSTQNVIPDFELINIDNQYYNTKNNNAKGFVVVFTCNHCPFAQLYAKRLNELSEELKKLHVVLIAINSMDTILYEDEGFSFMQAKAQQEKATYPYLQDSDQKIGKIFRATHTPQAFVLWRENGQLIVKYQGAIDDNSNDSKKAHNYALSAVNSLLKNKKIKVPITKSFGCKIYYR